MSLKLRLTITCGFFLLVIFSVAAIGFAGSQKLASSLGNVAQTQLPAVRNMTLVDMMHDGLRAVVFRALFLANGGSAEEKKELAGELKEFAENIQTYMHNLEGLSLDPQTHAALAQSMPAVKGYVEAAERITELALSGQRQQAVVQLDEFQKAFKDLEDKLGVLGERIEKDAASVNTEGQQTPQHVLWISVVGILVGLGLSVWAVTSMISLWSGVHSNIRQVSEEMHGTSQSLLMTSQQLASSSQEQASSVEETSSSLEEISGMVASAVKGSEKSVELSNQVSELVKFGTESMSELQVAVNQIADANARVESLAKLIEEIGEKTDLIDEIVFQTRLLSFNASVEAERAGEHGRGFAVVAQEVGNLAQMSGKSATEIGQIVKNSIKEAREVVQMNRSKVELGVTLCRKTYEHFQAIEAASRKILDSSEQIQKSSEEQNAGIQQINKAIQLVSKTTQENASLAEAVSDNSSKLSEHGQSLATVVDELESMVVGRAQRPQDPRPQVRASTQPPSNVISVRKGAAPTLKPHAKPTAPSAHVANGNAAVKTQLDPWERL